MSTALRIFLKKFFGIYAVIFLGIRTNAISPPTQYIHNIPKAPIYSDLNTSFRPPRQDAAKKAAKRAKLEAELLARRLKAEEKQRKKDEKKRLKKEKQQELAPPERKDEKSDEDNSKSDESNLTVHEKAAEELNTDNAAVPIEKADTEDLKENAEQQADTDDEQEDDFVWYKSVEHKSPKKSIKEKLSPEKIKAGIKKSVNTVFVKPFVFVKEMFRDEIFPAAGRSFKKMLTKQFAIFLAVVVVIGAAGYGGGHVGVEEHQTGADDQLVGVHAYGGGTVEAEPAEPENEHAQSGKGQVVA